MLTFSQEALLVENSHSVGSQQARLKELPQHTETIHGIPHDHTLLSFSLADSYSRFAKATLKANEGFLQDLVGVALTFLLRGCRFFSLVLGCCLLYVFFGRLQPRQNWKRRGAVEPSHLGCRACPCSYRARWSVSEALSENRCGAR